MPTRPLPAGGHDPDARTRRDEPARPPARDEPAQGWPRGDDARPPARGSDSQPLPRDGAAGPQRRGRATGDASSVGDPRAPDPGDGPRTPDPGDGPDDGEGAPHPDRRVQEARSRFHAWMVDDALPFWAGPGLDGALGGFHEQVSADGAGLGDVPRRVRVQARQVYVFSHAFLHGWPGGLAAARQGLSFLRRGARADGSWARVLSPGGAVLDPVADLYDQAFVLFALAWYARASGEDEPLAEARRTLDWIWRTMAAPGGRGLHNAWPPTNAHRQQNPHMHLLEAVLALHDADPHPRFAARADELVSLFHGHFFHAPSGTLGEFFDHALDPAEGEAGSHVEPGHHYEWVWLLDRHQRQLARPDAAEAMAALYGFAERHGSDPGRGLVLDVLGRDGRVRRPDARLWPQTEAIKAHAVMARRGRDTAGRLGDTVDALLRHYLSRRPPGTWFDSIDAAGRPDSRPISASSFYHIYMAYAELDRLARGTVV